MNWKKLLLSIAAPLCWGTSFTLAKPVLAHFSPIFMMAMVYAAIALIMFFTVRDDFKTHKWQLVVISALAVTLQGALLFAAVPYLEATTSNLVLQTQVPAAVVMGWLIAGEKLSAQKVVGTLIAVIGVMIVIGLPEQKPAFWPVVSVVVGGFIWASGQVLARMWSKETGVMQLKANAYFGVPQLILATAILEQGQWQSVMSATPMDWALLLFVGFVGFYLAYIFWYSLLRIARVDEAVPFILLMTPIGIVTAVLFLGERMSLAQIVGAVVLMFGLAVVNGVGVPKRFQAA
ncbi:MAG: EamA family transporter [Alphaproteobacteria bacterium]|nr:EamA family transporter [Alphaproteobacteria bacterium]